ncbi:hypothetical protein Cgig2_002936 [Carnegiea gigantea]|uniref:Uncharacterized protein n=1 Tax=Carnegiea gigantea TaxID=171969 RepID=A0A9Q1GR87_9CARY|nr:hypothetical protein Cgig2_002936 [Carnegiea gigantea]
MKKLRQANRGWAVAIIVGWMVMSGLFFPRTQYGAAWDVQKYIDYIGGLGQYLWAEVVQRVLVESLEEIQKKLYTEEVFHVWFYEHTKCFEKHDRKSHLRIVIWDKVDHGGWYDAFKLFADIKELEVIPVLLPRNEEKVEPIVAAFLGTDYWRYYVIEADVIYEEPVQQGGANDGVRENLEYHVINVRVESVGVQHLHGAEKARQHDAEGNAAVKDLDCSPRLCGGAVGNKGDYVQDDPNVDYVDGDNSLHRSVANQALQSAMGHHVPHPDSQASGALEVGEEAPRGGASYNVQLGEAHA